MKNKKWYVISTFVLGCIVMNFAGRILADRLQLPFLPYADEIRKNR